MENGSNTWQQLIFPRLWNEEEGKWSSLLGTIASERGLHREPRLRNRALHKCKSSLQVCCVLEAGDGRMHVYELDKEELHCPGFTPHHSMLPSKLM